MSIEENKHKIENKIKASCEEWGREPASVKLIAVSKVQPDEKLDEALKVGQRIFGENRVQEAYAHWEVRKEKHPDLKLHLIGPLQTNKVKEAVKLFDVIHTVDREKLARKLSKEMQEQGKNLPCFIQINIGEEEQKAGIHPKELPAFLEFCRTECALDIIGLMCIPPIDEPAALYFGLLRNMAREHDLKELSMGMSSDYEKAIALDATYIRVGTDFFGERTYS